MAAACQLMRLQSIVFPEMAAQLFGKQPVVRMLERGVGIEDGISAFAGDADDLSVGSEVGNAQIESNAALLGAFDVAGAAQLHVGFCNLESVGSFGHDFQASPRIF